MKSVNFPIFILLILLNFSCNGQKEESNSRKTVEAAKILKLINSGKPVDIRNSYISGILDFSSLENPAKESQGTFRNYISSPIYFEDCIFENEIIAFKRDTASRYYFTAFEKNLSFIKCQFRKPVDFQEIQVGGIVNFLSKHFPLQCNIRRSSFQRPKSLFQ